MFVDLDLQDGWDKVQLRAIGSEVRTSQEAKMRKTALCVLSAEIEDASKTCGMPANVGSKAKAGPKRDEINLQTRTSEQMIDATLSTMYCKQL